MTKKLKDRTPQEIEDNWNVIWKEILERPDGSIDKEQLKKELMDFSDLTHRMISLTSQITGGKLSYATYPVSTIMAVHEEYMNKREQEHREDDKEAGECSLCGQEIEAE